MDQNNMQQEITIIKNMIDKTRRETAQSGNFFIAIGIFGIFSTFTIAAMEEISKLQNYVLHALIVNLVLSAAVAYFFLSRAEKKEKVKTYAKTVFLEIFQAPFPEFFINYLLVQLSEQEYSIAFEQQFQVYK